MCSPGIELGLCRRQARPVRGERSKFESVLLGQMVMRPSKRLLYTSTTVHANEIRVAKSTHCVARRALTDTFEVQHVAEGVLRICDV